MNRSSIILLLLAISGFLSAQMDEVILPDLEVTVEQQSIEIRKLAASRKIVINQNDFESLGDITAGDIIKRYPGLWVQGPVGSNRNVLLCGLDKVFQSIMIDGNRPCGGEADREFKLDRIPLDVIDKIEIINIPTVDYCSDAVAGVVNIITKKNDQRNAVNIDVAPSVNSTDNNFGNGETYMSLKNKIFFLSASYNKGTRLNTEELEDTVSGISGYVEEDCNIEIMTFSGNTVLNAGENTKYSFDALFSNFDEIRDVVQDVKLRTQGGLNYRDIITDQTMLRRIFQGGISFDHKFDGNSNISSRLSLGRSDDEKYKYMTEEKSDGIAYTDEIEDQVNYEYLFSTDYKDLGTELFAKPNTFKTGLKLDYLTRNYNRYVKTTEITSTDSILGNEDGSFDYRELQAGLYLRDEVFIKPVIYSLGFRTEYAVYDYEVISDGQTGNNSYLFINPSLLINYKLNENYIFKAGLSRQIARPPFASVVPVDKIKTKKNQIERGNPGLLPADALTYNLGVEFYKGKDFYSVYGYFKDVKDIIEIENVGIDEATGYTINQFVNISTALVFGVDFEYSVDLGKIGMKNFSFSGNYSWMGSQVEDRNTGLMRRIAEQPMNIVNANLTYKNDPFIVSFGGNFTDEKIVWATIVDGQFIDKTVTGRYIQFDSSVKYMMSKKFLLYFNVNNIFGESVTVTQGDVIDIEEVGTTYTLGIKYGITDF